MPATSRLIEAAWKSYAERVFPVNTPIQQRAAAKRDFFAGAQAVLTEIMLRFNKDEPTEDDILVLKLLEFEIANFAVEVKRGLS